MPWVFSLPPKCIWKDVLESGLEPKESQGFQFPEAPRERPYFQETQDLFSSRFVMPAIHALFSWLDPWVPLGRKLPKGRKCLFYSLRQSRHLESYSVHRRGSINICGMSEWYYLVKGWTIANSSHKFVAISAIRTLWQEKSVIGRIVTTPIPFSFGFNFRWVPLYVFISIQLYFL